MSGPPPPGAQRWHLRFTAQGPGGKEIVLLEQHIVWMVGPTVSLTEYGWERWEVFLAGLDPLCPDLRRSLEEGGADRVQAVLTDGAGHTATFGPISAAAARHRG